MIGKYTPEYCVWELTLKCNMRCRHCGSKAGSAKKGELKLSECLQYIAPQLVNLGCKHVTLIGGEVFLKNGWEQIARLLSDNGVNVNIITNGYVLGDKEIEQIKHAKLTNVGVSLDGIGATHNYIRNVHDAFTKVDATFDVLRHNNIKVAVVTTLTDKNFIELESIYDYIVKKGVRKWQIQLANPMGNMAYNKNMLLSPDRIPIITKFIREKRTEDKIQIYTGDNIGYFDENEDYIRDYGCKWQGCQAGLSVIGIDSIGNVRGCESLQSNIFIEGNVRMEMLKDIWNKEGNFAYNRNFSTESLSGNCKDCDKGEICRGGCRGSCFFNTKNNFENAYCQYRVIQVTSATIRIKALRAEKARLEAEREALEQESEIATLEAEIAKLKKDNEEIRRNKADQLIKLEQRENRRIDARRNVKITDEEPEKDDEEIIKFGTYKRLRDNDIRDDLHRVMSYCVPQDHKDEDE